MKRIIFVAAAALLAGCATTKPEMPVANYQLYALYDVGASKCVEQGFMDVQTAAAAKNFTARDLNSWQYDPVVYQAAVASMNTKATAQPPKKSDCEAFAVGVAQRQQREQQSLQQQQMALQQQQMMNQAIQSAMPKTTYCNQVGTQTFCNTW